MQLRFTNGVVKTAKDRGDRSVVLAFYFGSGRPRGRIPGSRSEDWDLTNQRPNRDSA